MSAPECKVCGGGGARVKSIRYVTNHHRTTGERIEQVSHEWWCAACEYAAAFPDAPKLPLAPNERRPKALQSEQLFPREGRA